MALGKPPISTPRTLELRVVAQAVENIRQRIEAIEGVSATTAAQAGESTLRAGQQNISISALRAQLVALAAQVAALAATDQELETFRAGSAIAIGTAVYPSGDGVVSQVDPSDPVKVYAVLGVATQTAAEGNDVVVRKAGVMQIADAVFEPGGPVYVGVDGLTQFPDYINLAIPVGVATSTDEIDVRPGWPALQHPGVYSEYETFLPATWGLVRDAVTLAQDFNSAGNGLAVKTGTDDVTTRTLTGTAARITLTDGDGVSGNPTVDIASTYVGQTSITTLGTVATGTWRGTAVAANFGGTGFTSYAVGDILYASTTSALSKLADVATGNALISGGVGVAPAWGKIGLTTHVSGTLPATNGGTGVANNAASTITILGAFASTFTVTGTTAVTFPTSGTLATTAQLPVGANPSASVGLTAVNGSATTFMRSDGAPALSQAITPTWTGFHVFTANPTALPASPISAAIRIAGTDSASPGGAGIGTSLLFDAFGGAAVIGLRRAGGTAASPTAVTGGQGVFNLQGFGYGSTGYTAIAPAVMSFNANETWTDTAQGSRAQFLVTPNGSAGSARVLAWTLTTAAMALPVDNLEVQIGAGADLRLYHDGTDSHIENDTGRLNIKSGGDLYLSEGQVALQTVGKGLSIKEGANAKQGIVTLVAGAAVVANTAVTATSRIMLTPQNASGGAGSVSVTARTAGTSFTIGSTNALDTRDIAYVIFEAS
jgi:hypothetical protein